MSNIQIVIQHLDQYYGKKQVLHDINLTIEKGMFGLLGRNGAGKTTFIKTLVTLLKKRTGDIKICDTPIENTAKIRKLVGYLPQDFSMYPYMTVKESLYYLGLLSGLDAAVIKVRQTELLQKVNLTEHQNKKVKALSGGMKRRLGIAQALLHDPNVLIVDEPTAGLDPEERIRIRNLLAEIAEKRIVILSTHIVGDIEATCEQIAILHTGRLIYTGTVSALLQSAEGKVYTATIASSDLMQFKKIHYVTGMLIQGQDVLVRFISEQEPTICAKLTNPNMEDAYMYYISRGDQ